MGFFFNGVFMFKKITVAVLALAASGLASAGAMGPTCTPGNVTVPCATRLWDLGVQALYLRSVYSSEKSFLFNESLFNKEVTNKWDGGFRLEGSYHFNTGNDVNINWMHYSTTINPTDYIGTLLLPIIPPPLQVAVPFELESKNRLDQVNVVMGQHIDLSMRDHMRFYGGLQYVNIQSTSNNFYTTEIITDLTGFTFSFFDNTDYKGFGPVIGLDYSYDITHGLSLTANGAGSILYGTSRYHSGYVIDPVELIPLQVFYRKKGIVPSFEAKLGINYAHSMAQGVANIQIGYQVVDYYNVLQAQPYQFLISPIRSVDYALFGPYFGFKYVGNV